MHVDGRKCRNSVFGILFLLWFFFGTICGVLLFRLSGMSSRWVRAYCAALEAEQARLLPAVCTWIRPLLAVPVLALVPWGIRVMPWLIAWRGCVMAFSASACYVGGGAVWPLVLRGFFLLLFYYGVCCLCRKQSRAWSCHAQ